MRCIHSTHALAGLLHRRCRTIASSPPHEDPPVSPGSQMMSFRMLNTLSALRVAALTMFVVVSAAALAIFVEPLPVGASMGSGEDAGALYLFDVIEVDGPELATAEIEEVVVPMAMVYNARMPSVRVHTQIVVYGAGPAGIIGADSGVAGFLPKHGVFFVDMQQVRKDRVLEVPRPNWWAFVMGHEAMHLVQQRRGEVFLQRRAEDYKNDPLEREAFREGLSVANSFGNYFLSWQFTGATPVAPTDPNTYRLVNAQTVRQQLTIRVSKTNTLRGTLKRVKNFTTRLSEPAIAPAVTMGASGQSLEQARILRRYLSMAS